MRTAERTKAPEHRRRTSNCTFTYPGGSPLPLGPDRARRRTVEAVERFRRSIAHARFVGSRGCAFLQVLGAIHVFQTTVRKPCLRHVHTSAYSQCMPRIWFRARPRKSIEDCQLRQAILAFADAQRRVRPDQGPTMGTLFGGIAARTDSSMLRCARTSSWGVKASHCASGRSSNCGLLKSPRKRRLVVPVFST
jgi:hypothetical protein